MLLKPAQSMNQNFKLVLETKPEKTGVPISFYRSSKTGLSVIIAEVEGPLVDGFFTVVTEAHDDDGLPHTLEHLVFMGSEKYPYKGILDLLANRCLADGTNAWTAIDHTSYTFETGGSEGFLNLLPVYLDHLLYPTLTDCGFITEVYHVTEAGEDAGVVYSEMQASENSADSRVWLETYRDLFPVPSGYCSETGGIMKNLRESTSIDKIRKYHKEMYRPENLHVIISGQIDPEKVFKALAPVETKIIAKGPRGPFTRPWETPVPPLTTSVDREIVFASDTEQTGAVCVGWRGPSVVKDLKELQSIEVLMEYLTKSSISILQQTFIEIEDPLASEIVMDVHKFSISGICLFFGGVPTNRTERIAPLLMEKLTALAQGNITLNLQRMKDIIRYTISHEAESFESEPHQTVAKQIISHILYGYSDQFISEVVNKRSWMEELLNKDESYWLSLLKKYLVGTPSIVIRGIPSIAESKRIHDEEHKRVEERKKKLGESGLKKFGELVASATATNEAPIPEDILTEFPLASVENVKFHNLSVYSNLEGVANSNHLYVGTDSSIDLKQIPVRMQINDIKSNFVQLTALLDCHSLSLTEKSYLPLLLNLLMESSMKKGEEIVPHDQVVNQLHADTFMAKTTQGATLSLDDPFTFGKFFEYAAINLKLETENYMKGIGWLKDMLYHVEFEAERVRVKTNKLLSTISELQRKGHHVLGVMQNYMLYNKDAVPNAGNCLRQYNFLKQLLQDLDSTPHVVLKSLQHVYKKITDANNIVIQVSTDFGYLSKQVDFIASWKDFFGHLGNPINFRLNATIDGDNIKKHLDKNYIASLGPLESGFLYQTTRSINDFHHDDLPALRTAIAYLTQLEGPMWKDIRGKGLAYSFRIILDPGQGTLKLTLAYAAQLPEAYKEAIKLIGAHINDPHHWSPSLFDSGKSSLMYEVINQQGYLSDVVQLSIYDQYAGIPLSYHRELLTRISKVTMEEMIAAAVKYFKPLIEPKTSILSAICPPSKMMEIKVELESFGHQLEVLENVRESAVSSL